MTVPTQAAAVPAAATTPTQPGGVPFAPAGTAVVWPVITTHPADRVVSFTDVDRNSYGSASAMFWAVRKGGLRRHAGVDIACYPGDILVAPEPLTLANAHAFYAGTFALLCQCDSGVVINFGECKNGSWHEFGLDIGSHVDAGEPIARVGRFNHAVEGDGLPDGMLHFEMYTHGTLFTAQIRSGQAVPKQLRNPTKYLIHAASAGRPAPAQQVLERGDMGDAVTRAQELLKRARGDFPVDGVFGGITEREVRRFQAGEGMTVSGIIDADTWGALARAAGNATA